MRGLIGAARNATSTVEEHEVRYLTNTFSPMMLSADVKAEVSSLASLGEIPTDLKSAVSHEVTAKTLSALLGREVPFNRVGLSLKAGDEVFCLIPAFRATEAREFSREEVEAAGFRAFHVVVR